MAIIKRNEYGDFLCDEVYKRLRNLGLNNRESCEYERDFTRNYIENEEVSEEVIKAFIDEVKEEIE